MLIYATLGNQYDLSEQRIREIVAEQTKKDSITVEASTTKTSFY
jgi:acyl carrier protein